MQCSYCQIEIVSATGVTVFKKDGSGQHYCSRRCERFAVMKRSPRQFKWTGKREKGKAQTAKKK